MNTDGPPPPGEGFRGGPPPDDNGMTNMNGTSAGATSDSWSRFGASGPEVLGLVWALTAIALLLLTARIYTKRRSQKGLWWDDYLLLASWTMLGLFAGTTTYCVHVGLGSHNGSDNVHMSPIQLGTIIATVFSVFGAAWSKTSFALTLLRITRVGESRVLYWGIWAIVVTLNLVLTFNAVIFFIYCDPPSGAWDSSIHAKCWNRNVVVTYTKFAAAYSAAMDFILAFVPWTVIMRLRMRFKEKLGVAVCMSLGVFAGATSVMRALTVPTLYTSDYTYESGQLFIWTSAELSVTIVAASIPILRALFSDLVTSRYNRGVTELNTFQTLKDGDGIRVTKETIITRTPSNAERGAAGWIKDDEEPLSPATPGPTYHSFLQKT